MSEELNGQEGTAGRGRPKSRIGVVCSNKMQKTVVVKVQRRVRHPKYGKYVLKAEKYKAHCEEHDPKTNPVIVEGDLVRIVETAPSSKDKRWRIAETLRKATRV